jgi:hypothetical protein
MMTMKITSRHNGGSDEFLNDGWWDVRVFFGHCIAFPVWSFTLRSLVRGFAAAFDAEMRMMMIGQRGIEHRFLRA